MYELREFQQKSDSLTFQDLLDCFACDPTLSKTLVESAHEPQGFSKKLVVRHQFLELCRQVVGLNMPALQCALEKGFERDASAPAPAASSAQDPGFNFAESFSSLGKFSEATGGGGFRPIFTYEGLPNMSWPFHCIPLNPNHLDSEYDAQCDSA